jgi:putative membrane protein
MILDWLLASFHHICVFALFVLLGAQIVLVRPGMDAGIIARVGRLDLFYGIIAGLTLFAGLLRVFFGAKDAGFYLGSHIFWTKLSLFLIIALLSIRPTLRFIAWRRALGADAKALPADKEVRQTRIFIHAQAVLFFVIPILAAAMARGMGMK